MESEAVTKLAFLDTETTGLDPDRHEIWEVGLIVRNDDREGEREFLWQLPVDLGRADPMTLNIGQFFDRRVQCATAWGEERVVPMVPRAEMQTMEAWAKQFMLLTRDAHLVGAVVSFDEKRLERLLRRLGRCPMWHYHLIDVEALAAGHAAGDGDATHGAPHDVARPPWSSADLSRYAGIDPDDFDRHTALGDARWARAIYDAVIRV